MNLGELKDVVQKSLGRNDQVVGELVRVHANNALVTISHLLVPDLEETVYFELTPNVYIYTMPENLFEVEVFGVQDVDGKSWILEVVSPQKWALLFAEEVEKRSAGKPLKYCLWKDTIWISPKPDREYRVYIWYWKQHPPLVEDEDEILLKRCLDFFVSYVTGLCWYSLEELDLGTAWITLAVQQLKLHTGVRRMLDLSANTLISSNRMVSGDYWAQPFVNKVSK